MQTDSMKVPLRLRGQSGSSAPGFRRVIANTFKCLQPVLRSCWHAEASMRPLVARLARLRHASRPAAQPVGYRAGQSHPLQARNDFLQEERQLVQVIHKAHRNAAEADIVQQLQMAGDKIASATPNFFGSNPAEVKTGPRAGLRILGREEDLGQQWRGRLQSEHLAGTLLDARLRLGLIACVVVERIFLVRVVLERKLMERIVLVGVVLERKLVVGVVLERELVVSFLLVGRDVERFLLVRL